MLYTSCHSRNELFFQDRLRKIPRPPRARHEGLSLQPGKENEFSPIFESLKENSLSFFFQDNFHDYLKYTFPRMKAPSFFIEQEAETSENTHCRKQRLHLISQPKKNICRSSAPIQEQAPRISVLRSGAGV